MTVEKNTVGISRPICTPCCELRVCRRFSGKGSSAGDLLWTGGPLSCSGGAGGGQPSVCGCYPSSLLVTFVFKDIQRCLILRVLFSKKLPCSLEMISHFQKREFTGFFCPSVLCSEDACWQRGLEGRAPLRLQAQSSRVLPLNGFVTLGPASPNCFCFL